jgi:RNA polymerase sigma-70 factor, ECF subfamily
MTLATTIYTLAHVEPDDTTSAATRALKLDRFLRGLERRALRIAELSTGHREDALELVQDAMLGFVRRYGDKPEAEWAPLFHRVLDTRIVDWHRRSQVRRRFRAFLGRPADEDDAPDPMAQVADPNEAGPVQDAADGDTRRAIDAALRALPLRQRQAFLLRMWEGLDVAATAAAMRCSEGSVKTHLFRALAALRTRLEAVR